MDNGDTPMHMAAYKARIDIMEQLLTHTHKADINLKNQQGKTPLLCVIEHDEFANIDERIECVKYLLDHGAQVTLDIINIAKNLLPDSVSYLEATYINQNEELFIDNHDFNLLPDDALNTEEYDVSTIGNT